MMAWLDEFLFVLAYSKRTQWAIWLGAISFAVILVAGEHFVGGLNFHGPLSPLTDVVRETLLDRYDKAAWSSLGAFLLLATKCYRRDRKRVLAL